MGLKVCYTRSCSKSEKVIKIWHAYSCFDAQMHECLGTMSHLWTFTFIISFSELSLVLGALPEEGRKAYKLMNSTMQRIFQKKIRSAYGEDLEKVSISVPNFYDIPKNTFSQMIEGVTDGSMKRLFNKGNECSDGPPPHFLVGCVGEEEKKLWDKLLKKVTEKNV